MITSVALAILFTLPAHVPVQDKPVAACTLLTTDEIKKAGRAVPFASPPDGTALKNGGSECEYAGDVAVQLDAYPVSAFEATRKNFETAQKTTFTPVTGVGDQAYYFEHGPASVRTAGIFVRAGSHVVTVTMGIGATSSADANRTVLTALTKSVLAKLK